MRRLISGYVVYTFVSIAPYSIIYPGPLNCLRIETLSERTMHHARRILQRDNVPVLASVQSVATAYNGAGRNYAAYADGAIDRLFNFSGLHSFADQKLWSHLDAELVALRNRGVATLRILDAGCGPGTWLRRIVTRARELGFEEIFARGFDIAQVQVDFARRNAAELANLSGVTLKFDCGDLLSPLPETSGSVDIVICFYSVLSHITAAQLPKVLGELARVTKGFFITTVRTVGSEPSIFIDSLDKAQDFRLDYGRNRCKVRFRNGSEIELPMHLFTAQELRNLVQKHFAIEDLSGLDIFHSRFAPDRRWNPPHLGAERRIMDRLSDFEALLSHDPEFIDRANHLLCIARPTSDSLA